MTKQEHSTLENKIVIPGKIYMPHQHLKIDRNTLKIELGKYKEEHQDKNFDNEYIQGLENLYNIRFVGVHLPLDPKNRVNYRDRLKHDYMNVFAYSSGNKTETMHLEKLTKSTTVLRFSKKMFEYILPRISQDTSRVDDKLTSEALNAIDNMCKYKTKQAYEYMLKIYKEDLKE